MRCLPWALVAASPLSAQVTTNDFPNDFTALNPPSAAALANGGAPAFETAPAGQTSTVFLDQSATSAAGLDLAFARFEAFGNRAGLRLVAEAQILGPGPSVAFTNTIDYVMHYDFPIPIYADLFIGLTMIADGNGTGMAEVDVFNDGTIDFDSSSPTSTMFFALPDGITSLDVRMRVSANVPSGQGHALFDLFCGPSPRSLYDWNQTTNCGAELDIYPADTYEGGVTFIWEPLATPFLLLGTSQISTPIPVPTIPATGCNLGVAPDVIVPILSVTPPGSLRFTFPAGVTGFSGYFQVIGANFFTGVVYPSETFSITTPP